MPFIVFKLGPEPFAKLVFEKMKKSKSEKEK